MLQPNVRCSASDLNVLSFGLGSEAVRQGSWSMIREQPRSAQVLLTRLAHAKYTRCH